MSNEFIMRMIDEAVSFGVIELIVFTGGEPFLLGEDLFKAIEYASKRGFLTRIVTNAYWAKSPDIAQNTIQKLKSVGLTELNISCDDFHQEFIPLNYIRWANEAAKYQKLPTLIVSKGIQNSAINIKYLEEKFQTKLTVFNPNSKNPDNDLITYGITVPVGWQSECLSEDDLLYSQNEDVWKIPCDEILSHVVITPNGDVAACCGCGSEGIPELIIGNTRNQPLIDLIGEGNRDIIWNWLSFEGPYGIMCFIQNKDPMIKFREKYVNNCHLCHDIFSRREIREILSENLYEKVPWIYFKRAWLENNREMWEKNNTIN